ncbi:MAG: ATP-dependent Clp protease adaptor ClpS [Treponema sp.]|jgi:ATP-dependent Clp protease adaptor protein ClpS|nr:ATP-dependent Clp protease adaptor ClpS [Treponema sp.]
MPALARNNSKTLPKKKEKLQEPRDYRVVLLNDNYTTQEFVVEVLESVFHLRYEDAAHIMKNVHHKGRGVVGTYTWDIAQTRVNQVHALAEKNNFPLRCVVEEV